VPYKRLAQDQSLNEHEQLEVDRALTWLDDLSPVFTLLTGETLRSLERGYCLWGRGGCEGRPRTR